MNVYLLSNNREDMEEKIECINFDVVLLRNGCFPSNSCIWAGYEQKYEHASKDAFESLERRFQLSKLGIYLMQSTVLPETLIWGEHNLETLIVIGTADELKTYISRLCVHLQEGRFSDKEFPNNFVYRLECSLVERSGFVTANTLDCGFLYRDDK